MKFLIHKSFPAFLILALCRLGADAQIVYTDINPDQTLEQKTNGSQTYLLDLNNDGVNDYTLSVTYSNDQPLDLRYVTVSPLNDNEVLDTFLYSSSYYPQDLVLGDSIGMQRIWQSSSGTLSHASHVFGQYFWNYSGLWNGTYYLGLRIKNASHFYYGWLQISAKATSNDATLTVFDYAFNDILDQSILAGDTGTIATSIHHIKNFSSIAISPNSFQHLTRISFSLAQPEKISVIVYDVMGRKIKVLSNEMMSEGNHQLQWKAEDENGNAVSTGIYFLQFQSSTFSQTEKLMVVE